MSANTTLTEWCIGNERRRLYVWGRTESERRSLRRRAQSGELARVGHGCYVRGEMWDRLSAAERYRWLVRTLSVRHPDWVFGDITAAVMYGITDSARHLGALHLAVNQERCGKDRGDVRYCLLPDDEYGRSATVGGVRVTSLGRTVFDCLRRLDFPDGIVIVESVLRQGIMTRDEMRSHCLTLPGRHRLRALLAVEQAPGDTRDDDEAYGYGVMVERGLVTPRHARTP